MNRQAMRDDLEVVLAGVGVAHVVYDADVHVHPLGNPMVEAHTFGHEQPSLLLGLIEHPTDEWRVELELFGQDEIEVALDDSVASRNLDLHPSSMSRRARPADTLRTTKPRPPGFPDDTIKPNLRIRCLLGAPDHPGGRNTDLRGSTLRMFQ